MRKIPCSSAQDFAREGQDLDTRVADGYYPFDTASNFNDECVVAETPIRMWQRDQSIKSHHDGSYDEGLVLSKVLQKPISEIRV